jgi:hypothetical protein
MAFRQAEFIRSQAAFEAGIGRRGFPRLQPKDLSAACFGRADRGKEYRQ